MDKQITHYEQAMDDLFHKRLLDTARSELKTTPRKHLIVERAFYRALQPLANDTTFYVFVSNLQVLLA